LHTIKIPERQYAKVSITPGKTYDIGSGYGQELASNVEGGVVGIIIDARGRPLKLSNQEEEQKKMLMTWYNTLDIYPQKIEEL
jgi:hypothetical protein